MQDIGGSTGLAEDSQMFCDDVVVRMTAVSKSFLLFDKPSHRLWQMLLRGHVRFYNEHQVLRSISIDIKKGQTVGLVGRNGAGKSTLLSILCGTLTPTSGTVEVKGRVAGLLELGAGFNPELTGRENIDLCAQIYGLSQQEIGLRRESIIEFADIGDYIDRPVKTYSSGMFTRLGFSVVAHVSADILIIDEALAVGDAFFVQKCMRFLHNFRENGGTLIFVSHDMGSVTALCDRVIWIKDGGIAMDDIPKAVAGAYLEDLYNSTESFTRAAGHESGVRESSAIEVADAEDVDGRAAWINGTSIRNDIQVFKFTPGRDFGMGGASIERAVLTDDQGKRLAWLVGGEVVSLSILVRASRRIDALIVGFVVKDRQGQPLFGDNTYLTYKDNSIELDPGDSIQLTFEFRMPILPVGDYAITLAVSDGTQSEHVMQEWIHDAIVISSRSTSISTGLIGIPMRRIERSAIISSVGRGA